MKRILLLSLLLLPIVALAQYPTFSNKQKLGVQTTGDGLIYRGGIHPNYYTPSNINNAYFYLDTTTSKLYLYNDITWQQIYPTASDTISLGAYLLKSDTLAMLLPYLKKSDTISLSNRINNKLSLADTASMLLPYLKLADTTSMLTPYFRDSDTTMLNLITRFNSKLNTTDTVSLSNRIDLKLNKTDTINLSNRIDLKLNKSDTISLSNRIDIKLNASDTVSLSNRINKKLDTLYVNYQTNVDLLTNKDTINITPLEAGAGINITNNVISLDTTLLDSVVRVQNVYVKNGTGTVLNKGEAVYVTGANGTNIIVGRASNVAESSSSKTLGLTMTSIPVNGFGYVIKEGLLAGLNTNSANDGDPIWLSNIPGGLIFGLANKPYAPNHLVYLGIVTRKQTNNGEVYVTVQNGFEIKELHDVQIIDPENKASLYYNSSQSLWRDTTAALLVSDTASMLSKYVNTYSNQTGINGDKTFNNVVTIDSATITGKLLVNTNISDAVKISSNTNSTNLELMNSSGTVSIKSSNKNMILQTDTTALVYLNGNNKKVGILTMNPQQELEVAGNVRIDSLNNNIIPTRMVGSDNNGDLTNVNLGEGLSFVNDTLKVDLTIIDTAIAASSITLAGHVTGTGSTNSTVNTTISNNVVTNDMLTGGISDTKLNTITTTGKVDNSATTATSSNIANTIVLRDNNRDFTARNITATNFYGLASTATLANTIQSSNTTGIIKLTTSSNSVLPIITVPDVNATMATTNLNQTFGGTQTFSSTISGSINGNAATVTSVLPSNFASQTANTVLAAPNGSSGTPTFRSLVSSDIPSLNYLPLSGGVLSGALTGTTGTFTGLNVNNTNVNGEGILTLKSYNFNFANRIQFGDGAVIRREIIYPNSSSNMQFRSYTVGGSSGGYDFYVSNGSTESLAATIGTDKSLSLTGTLGVSSNITANSFIKSGGLSTQFLKANGSVDANTYLTTGTATSTYLPLTGGTLSGNLNLSSGIINTWQSAYLNAPRNNGPISYGYFFNLRNSSGETYLGSRITHNYMYSYDELTAAPATMYYGRFNGFYAGNFNANNANIIYDASIYYHNSNQFYYRAFSEPENKVTFSIKPSTTVDVLTGTKADLYLSGDAQIDRSLNIGTTLGVTGATTLSSLQGTGTRMVVANSTGVLSTQAIPTGTLVGTDTVSLSNRINTKVGLTGNETINGTKTFGGLIVPTNGMQLTATGNNSNKLLGLNVSSIVGEITLGSGLSLSNNVLSVTTTSGGFVTTNSDYAVTITDTWIVFNNNFSNITVTLPNAATSTGRTLYFRNAAAGSIVSAGTANIIDNTVTTGTPNNNILGAGNTNVKWCTLVSNGTYWIKMQAGSL